MGFQAQVCIKGALSVIISLSVIQQFCYPKSAIGSGGCTPLIFTGVIHMHCMKICRAYREGFFVTWCMRLSPCGRTAKVYNVGRVLNSKLVQITYNTWIGSLFGEG